MEIPSKEKRVSCNEKKEREKKESLMSFPFCYYQFANRTHKYVGEWVLVVGARRWEMFRARRSLRFARATESGELNERRFRRPRVPARGVAEININTG